MKKLILSVILIIVVIAFSLFIYSGFTKCFDVFIANYTLSEDGSTMTLDVTRTSSMGFVRDVTVKSDGNKAYLSFYQAFGGLNSKIGAKNTYNLKLDSAWTEIYVQNGEDSYSLRIKKKESSGSWVWANLGESSSLGAVYIYENGGFSGIDGDNFIISVRDDGKWTYTEGMASSHLANPDKCSWMLENEMLVLTEKRYNDEPMINYFKVDGENLIYQSENSSNFIYTKLEDGAVFNLEE